MSCIYDLREIDIGIYFNNICNDLHIEMNTYDRARPVRNFMIFNIFTLNSQDKLPGGSKIVQTLTLFFFSLKSKNSRRTPILNFLKIENQFILM